MRSASMNGWWYGSDETPGAEADVPRALRGGGDEHLGRGDDLVAGRVVLAEPGLVEAELVEVLDELQVAFERQGGVLAHGVERGQEDAELESAVGVNGRHGPPGFSVGLMCLGRVHLCADGSQKLSTDRLRVLTTIRQRRGCISAPMVRKNYPPIG